MITFFITLGSISKLSIPKLINANPDSGNSGILVKIQISTCYDSCCHIDIVIHCQQDCSVDKIDSVQQDCSLLSLKIMWCKAQTSNQYYFHHANFQELLLNNIVDN
jgi:hypothetical protein